MATQKILVDNDGNPIPQDTTQTTPADTGKKVRKAAQRSPGRQKGALRDGSRRERVLTLLRSAGTSGLTVSELAKQTGSGRNGLYVVIKQLLSAKEIEETGVGRPQTLRLSAGAQQAPVTPKVEKQRVKRTVPRSVGGEREQLIERLRALSQMAAFVASQVESGAISVQVALTMTSAQVNTLGVPAIGRRVA